MLIKSKGNTVEIAPGVKFVENNHSLGVVYHLETITEVDITDNHIIANKPCKVYRWQARNTETGEIIDYGINEDYLQYGPRLFQTIEDAKDFWEYGKRK